MKIKSFFLTMICSEKIIKNADLPSCKNCIYYEPKNENDYSSLNKCNKFGVKNIINDEINYDYADSCRNDENKCGMKGKYFEEETNPNMKMLKYNLTNYKSYPLLLTVIIVILECYLIIKK